MKVYEKLGLPYLTREQCELLDGLCPAEVRGEECRYEMGKPLCIDCIHDCLMSDVPVKKVRRHETYNGDFMEAWNDYSHFVGHKPVTNNILFACWLMEEIEVEEWNQ